MGSVSAIIVLIACRWRVAALAAPVAAVVVALRWLVWQGGVDSIAGLDSSVMQPTIITCIFVCSLLLTGVLSDYKEAERLPAEAECALRTIVSGISRHTQHDRDARSRALALAQRTLTSFVAMLDSETRYADFSAEVATIEDALSAELGGATTPAIDSAFAILCARAARLCTIRDTSFPLPAYALVDTMTALVSGVVVTVRLSDPAAGYFVSAAFPFIFGYMGLLLRRLDDPFQYPPGFHAARMAAALGSCGGRASVATPSIASPPTSVDCRILVEDLALHISGLVNKCSGKATSAGVASGSRPADTLEAAGATRLDASQLRTRLLDGS